MEKQRNYGLDIARTIAMCGIVTLHVLLQGGILNNCKPLTINYGVSWWLEIVAYCSVDLFAILSGILGIKSKRKSVFRTLELICVVLFYSVIITLFFFIFAQDKVGGIKGLIYGLVPALDGRYWYISCYIPLALLQPFINKAILSLSEKQHRNICIVSVAVFTILPSLTMRDFFHIDNGYSFVWLLVCYIIGAYIGRTNFLNKIKKIKVKSVIVFFICSFVLLFGNILIYVVLHNEYKYFVEYTSPLVLIMSICVIAIFDNLQIKKFNKTIITFSTLTFDVYVIHCHKYVYDYLIADSFKWISELPFFAIPFVVIACVMGIFLICVVCGFIRNFLFEKIINKILIKISKPIDKLIYVD